MLSGLRHPMTDERPVAGEHHHPHAKQHAKQEKKSIANWLRGVNGSKHTQDLHR
jgi:hypothetical protein